MKKRCTLNFYGRTISLRKNVEGMKLSDAIQEMETLCREFLILIADCEVASIEEPKMIGHSIAEKVVILKEPFTINRIGPLGKLYRIA